MLQITYHSRSLVQSDDRTLTQVLREILAQSRINNERDGLTGYLLLDRVWFAQILEGETEKVRSAMARIAASPFHTDLTVISERLTRERCFPLWSMGGTARTAVTEDIFRRHGVGAEFDPRRLTVPGIISLAMDLQDTERYRVFTAQAAAAAPTSG